MGNKGSYRDLEPWEQLDGPIWKNREGEEEPWDAVEAFFHYPIPGIGGRRIAALNGELGQRGQRRQQEISRISFVKKYIASTEWQMSLPILESTRKPEWLVIRPPHESEVF